MLYDSVSGIGQWVICDIGYSAGMGFCDFGISAGVILHISIEHCSRPRR